jgi:hypothetical protein
LTLFPLPNATQISIFNKTGVSVLPTDKMTANFLKPKPVTPSKFGSLRIYMGLQELRQVLMGCVGENKP